MHFQIAPSRFRWLATAVLAALLAGCPSAAFESPKSGDAAAAPEAPAADAPPAPQDAPPAQPEQPRQNALQREARFVDRNKFLEEHPDAIELEKNVINAGDPFTAYSQGYFAGVSSLMLSNLRHDLDLQKQLNNDKWPTFDAYKAILDMHGVKLKGLKKGQVYAYDDQTGQVSILELPEEAAAP